MLIAQRFSRYGRKAASVVRRQGGNAGVQPARSGPYIRDAGQKGHQRRTKRYHPNRSRRSISVPGTPALIKRERFLRCNARRSGAPVRGSMGSSRRTYWLGFRPKPPTTRRWDTVVGVWGRRLRPARHAVHPSTPQHSAAAQRRNSRGKRETISMAARQARFSFCSSPLEKPKSTTLRA